MIGTGFEANEAVTVGYLATLTAGGQQQISVTGQADPSGNISIALPVPVTVAGDTTYTVTAVGQTSGFTASAQLTVSLNPQLSANPSTVNSGGTVSISGQQFPQNTTATITGQIPLANGGSQTVSPTAQVGSDGTFAVQVPIPANAASGSVTFTASAVDPSGQTYTATTTVTITSIPATISLSSGTASPGDQLTVTGAGFAPGPNALITLALTYATNNGQQTATQMIDASSSGTFTTVLAVPGDAISGTATITATQVASGETASTTLAIQTPLPTSTPTSTPTATSVPPTPTASPVPPTSTATPVPKSPVHLKIKYVSLWYHAVRLGTFNHVEIRTNKKMQLPVTMLVSFPKGRELTYTGFTTDQGVWDKTFPVARNVTNRSGSLAQIRITVKRKFTATVILSFLLIG